MRLETGMTERKTLAQAIGEWIHEPVHYDGVPKCSYSIGPVKVLRDGSIETEDADAWAALTPFFQNNGWLPEAEQQMEEHIETVAAGASDLEAADGDGIKQIDISLPIEDFTPEQLNNLLRMIYSKQALLNRSFGVDLIRIPNVLIAALEVQIPESPADFTAYLDRTEADLQGFDFRDGKLTVSFPFDEAEPTQWELYATLLNGIVKAARTANRTKAEIQQPGDNEKYFMHSWLIRLGFGGADFKALRALLLNKLTGYCAFPDKERADRHKAKYAEIRQIKKSVNEEADNR